MNKIFSRIKKNYRSLTGSFILALLLWVAIKSDNEYTHTIDVPIVVSSLGENLVLKKKPPSSVKLRIKGYGRSLLGLNFIDQKIGLEFPKITSDQVINLEDYKSKFQFPEEFNIKVVSVISPKQLKLEVDTYAERLVPIRVSKQIKPDAGYLLVSYTPLVDTVLVKGPRTFVDAMQFVGTSMVTANGIHLSFEQTVNVINEHSDVVSISPQIINVKFVIEQLVERTVYNIPIEIIDVPSFIKAEATPATISVRVKGGETQISALVKEDIKVLFNYGNNFVSGRTNYPMQIKTPENITWVEVSPTSFNIKLLRKENNR